MKPKKKSKKQPSSHPIILWWRDKHLILQFVSGFVIILGLYYILTTFNILHTYIFGPYLEVTAFMGSKLLNLLGQATTVSESVISSSAFSMEVARGCDALEPTMIFVAAVLAFPAYQVRKWPGLLIGAALIFVLNFGRIIGLFLIGRYLPAWFDVMHEDILQVLFVFIAIGLWAGWLVWAVKRQATHANS